MATGSIIENMSSRKLGYILAAALISLIICGILGGVVSPTPNATMQYLATKCIDKSAGQGENDPWFWPRGKGACQSIEHFDDPKAQDLTADNIVFTFQMPLPRDNVNIDFSR